MRLESEVVPKEMMDQHRTKIENRFDFGARWSSDSTNAGDNIVELLFDIPVLFFVGGQLPVSGLFEDLPFVTEVRNTFVAQLLARSHNARPFAAFS